MCAPHCSGEGNNVNCFCKSQFQNILILIILIGNISPEIFQCGLNQDWYDHSFSLWGFKIFGKQFGYEIFMYIDSFLKIYKLVAKLCQFIPTLKI